jgi:hypothetical protein
MSKHPKTRNRDRVRHAGAGTKRRKAPILVDGKPLPGELTGRASGTSEDLTALFAGDTAEHFADGFSGGSDDDSGSDLPKDANTRPDAEEDVTAV